MPRRSVAKSPKNELCHLTFDIDLEALRCRLATDQRLAVGESMIRCDALASSWGITSLVVGPGSTLHSTLNGLLTSESYDVVELRPAVGMHTAKYVNLSEGDTVHWIGGPILRNEVRQIPLVEGRGHVTCFGTSKNLLPWHMPLCLSSASQSCDINIPSDKIFVLILDEPLRFVWPAENPKNFEMLPSGIVARPEANCQWVQITDQNGWPRLILSSIPGVALNTNDELRCRPHKSQMESLNNLIQSELAELGLKYKLLNFPEPIVSNEFDVSGHERLRENLAVLVERDVWSEVEDLKPLCLGLGCYDCQRLEIFRHFRERSVYLGDSLPLKPLCEALCSIFTPGQLRLYRKFPAKGSATEMKFYMGIIVEVNPNDFFISVFYPEDEDGEDLELADVLTTLGDNLKQEMTRFRGHPSWVLVPQNGQCDECFECLDGEAYNCCRCSASVHVGCAKAFPQEPWEWKCKYCSGGTAIPPRKVHKRRQPKLAQNGRSM